MKKLMSTVSSNSSSSSSPQEEPYHVSETSFDTNMVIILVALLCAVIGAVGLNTMVRCARRRWRPSRGVIKKRALKQIPVAVYGGGEIPGTECAICLGEFEEGEKVRVLPKCNHGFHVGCIDTWLLSHSSSCPNCRHSVLLSATSTPPPSTHHQPDQATNNTAVVISLPLPTYLISSQASASPGS